MSALGDLLFAYDRARAARFMPITKIRIPYELAKKINEEEHTRLTGCYEYTDKPDPIISTFCGVPVEYADIPTPQFLSSPKEDDDLCPYLRPTA